MAAGSVDFDGVDDHVDHGSGASLDDLAALTVAFWIYPRTLDTSFRRVAIKRDAGGGRWEIQYGGSSSTLSFGRTYSGGESAAVMSSPPAINTLTWVCATEAAGQTPKLFTGGAASPAVEAAYSLQTTATGTLTTDAGGSLIIGRRIGVTPYDGLLFRPVVLNTYLGATGDQKWIERLRRLSARQVAATFGAACALAAEYASNTDLADVSGNGNNGTATGSPANGSAFDPSGSPVVRLR